MWPDGSCAGYSHELLIKPGGLDAIAMKSLSDLELDSSMLNQAVETAERVKKRESTTPPKISSTLALAEYLGLSEWTVSRAINGHPEVKTATRERILKAMDEIGFRPNPVARGLSGKGMGIIGVCFGNTQNTIMIDKITLLDKFLRGHDLRAILAISPKDEEGELRILEDFRHLRVDGIVLIQSYLASSTLQKVLKGIPCVQVDPADAGSFHSVTLDRPEAMRQMVTHLLDLGHRSFATLGFSSTNSWRWQGVVAAFRDYGLSVERNVQAFELADPGDESYAEGMELARMALGAKKRATALVAINDRVAEAVIQKIEDEGLAVPRDFSVVGFDNLTMGQHLRPTLTTVDQQPHKLISQAGNLLLEQLGRKIPSSDEKHLIVEPLLIVRESSGPVLKKS